jgi:hypothetical protein
MTISESSIIVDLQQNCTMAHIVMAHIVTSMVVLLALSAALQAGDPAWYVRQESTAETLGPVADAGKLKREQLCQQVTD